MIKTLLKLVEIGIIPDYFIRSGIRQLLKRRIKEEQMNTVVEQKQLYQKRLEELRQSPIALVPEKANEQHYELPPEFFKMVLGPLLKYSSCYYPEITSTLEEAEKSMLTLTCKRAELKNNQSILELGCGWGSLTLWAAKQYPDSSIVAVSNSSDQKEFILARAQEQGLTNIEVITCDMNDFSIDSTFDRVLSIEMFEHMRNYKLLLQRISTWMKPEAKLFVHIFCHNQLLYPFEARNEADWMARYFFTGGLMPSYNTLAEFQDDVQLVNHWKVNGVHYARSSRDWIKNIDENRNNILELFRSVYGNEHADTWFKRWRLFFMACEELFGYNQGEEWFVGHYLFNKRI